MKLSLYVLPLLVLILQYDGKSALHLAAEKGYVDICRLLVENHANLDVQDHVSIGEKEVNCFIMIRNSVRKKRNQWGTDFGLQFIDDPVSCFICQSVHMSQILTCYFCRSFFNSSVDSSFLCPWLNSFWARGSYEVMTICMH